MSLRVGVRIPGRPRPGARPCPGQVHGQGWWLCCEASATGLNVEFLGVARTLIVVSGASGALYTQLQIAVVWVIHNLKSLPELK